MMGDLLTLKTEGSMDHLSLTTNFFFVTKLVDCCALVNTHNSVITKRLHVGLEQASEYSFSSTWVI
jgi:hypothetical protein